ncbi:MAG: DUF1127 domain-containing protein [Burkholderiales bacterium]|nr:DUF1127 domain-containing protein [Burkholderiales bacterium]
MQAQQTLRLPAPTAAAFFARLSARVLDAWRRQRLHRATVETLSSLDDRTLRDLGFHRSEIGSISAEIGGRAELDRVRAQLGHALRA